MSVGVRDVVGELELVEGDTGPGHPLLAGGRRVRVDAGASWKLRVGFAGDHPARVVELVAAVVVGHDVHHHDVLGLLVEAADAHFQGGEHASV